MVASGQETAAPVRREPDLAAGLRTIMKYDLSFPPSIRFGWGRLDELGEALVSLGEHALLVVGHHSFVASGAEACVAESLARAGLRWKIVARSGAEPTVSDVATAASDLFAQLREGSVVVAIGGGATIDLAKAAAAIAANADGAKPPAGIAEWEAFVVDHLEGVGRQLPIRRAPPPLIAVPTTAGTGAEATRNAVISCPHRRFKKSLRSPLMVPRGVIVDPSLTRSSPARVAAASGLDAITQLIEAFVTRSATPVPQAIARAAIGGAIRALPTVVHHARLRSGDAAVTTEERAALEAMSHAALLSGLALANSGLGMAHGVAAALGVVCVASHGEACAVMLPTAIRVNLQERAASFAALERELAVDPSADNGSAAAAFLSRIEQLCDEVAAPRRLSQLGVTAAMLPWLSDNSGGNSMRGNPVEVTPAMLQPLLEAML